VTLPFS
jgi:hypothetical protein